MSNLMEFPETVEEFMEEYKTVDTEQVYSNGTEYVPIFRMKQWFQAHKAIPIEWIKRKAFEHPALSRNLFYQMIIEEWEKENAGILQRD